MSATVMPEAVRDWTANRGGIFASRVFDLYAHYLVRLRFNERVLGGQPKNPDLIESWLRTKFMGNDAELAITLRRTLQNLDVEIEVPENATVEEIMEAAKAIAPARNGCGFWAPPAMRGQLCLGGYQVKAMMKEATAIQFPWTGKPENKWGPTKKAPRSFLAESVFVHPAYYFVPLGRTEPDGVHVQIGHVSGPKGPRSTMTLYDYIDCPEIEFVVGSHNDAISFDQWRDILVVGQYQGLGAIRSLGFGTFEVMAFDRL
jgi:hypothetical protein